MLCRESTRVDQDELNQLLKKMLGNDAGRLGWVPYSGLDTLKQGTYYLMGYNPRRDQANRPLLETTGNAVDWSSVYTKQCWRCPQAPCEHMDAGGRLKSARAPPGQGDCACMLLLGTIPECIFSANAIFIQSPRARDLQNAGQLWDKCWGVHQKFLALVRPKWIICLGNGQEHSSFQLMRQKAKKPEPKVSNPCHADRPPDYRTGKLFNALFDIGDTSPLDVKVLGSAASKPISHPSLPETFH